MTALPTRTVTFTDLEASTRLWEQHPDAMQDALARHDEILREAIAAHDGHVVKTTGDWRDSSADRWASPMSASWVPRATRCWRRGGPRRARRRPRGVGL